MNEHILTVAITIFTSVVTASITYFVSIKTNMRNKELEIKREQAFKYFLPLKFIADELYYRLAHIEQKIIDKRDLNIQLPQNLDEKDYKWFYTDWVDYKNPKKGAGGYFFVTAIFMHAQLYSRINILLKEYPYLSIQLKQSLNEYITLNNDSQAERCYQNAINHKQTMKWVDIKGFMNLKGKIKLEKIIRSVRLATVMKGGVPYGLQPAFGQFLEKNTDGKTEQINYEEFVKILMDKEQRVKFSPLYNFYSELVDSDFNVDEVRLTKLRTLMVTLLVFRNAELI